MDCPYKCLIEIGTLSTTALLGLSALYQFRVSRRSRRHDLVAEHMQEFAKSDGMKSVYYRIKYQLPIFAPGIRTPGCREEVDLDDLLNHFGSLATGARVEGLSGSDLGSALYYLRAIASHPEVQQYLSETDLNAQEKRMSEMYADLRAYEVQSDPSHGPVQSATALAPSTHNWRPLVTLGRSHPFCYTLTSSNLYIHRGENCQIANTEVAVTHSAAFLTELRAELAKRFGDDAFPLSNSKDRVPAGEAADGLGSVFFQLSGLSPVLASALAAVLVSHGVLEQVHGRRGLHFRLGSAEAFEAFLAEMVGSAQPVVPAKY